VDNLAINGDSDVHTHAKEIAESLTPADALQILSRGNERFGTNLKANRNVMQQVNETRDGHFPFATIPSCIDSRTSAKLIDVLDRRRDSGRQKRLLRYSY
jgi:hypothetical protein